LRAKCKKHLSTLITQDKLIEKILEIFSTRELALFIWVIIFFIYILTNRKQRHSFNDVLSAFFARRLFIAFLSMIFYISILLFLLHKIKLWDFSLLKDSCFWTISSAAVLFFNIKKTENRGYFRDILKDNVKLIIILEFLLNLYTFSFKTELIFLPVLTFLVALKTYAQYSSQENKEHIKVVILMNYILGLIGIIILYFVINRIFTGLNNLFSISNLRSFTLPFILTTLTLPYFYILALYMKFEILFVRINIIFKDKNTKTIKRLKWKIVVYGNISLQRLKKIEKKIVQISYYNDDPSNHIKEIIAKPEHIKNKIGNNAKVSLFNNIEKTRETLSKNGIGRLSDWDSDEFGLHYCLTNYFSFDSNLKGMPNNFAYYLIGNKTYIKKLELTLNINNKINEQDALLKFKELTLITLKSLSLDTPLNLLAAIALKNEYRIENDISEIIINLEQTNIDTLTLSIETK
jgi:hypothetical protein